jgi:hypothetical protein
MRARHTFLALVTTVALWVTPSALSAQTSPRVLIGANLAMGSSGSTFADTFRYNHPYTANIPGEEASVDTTFEIPSGAMFEGGVLVRIFRNVAAGVAYYQASSTNDLQVTARIPHPLLITRHRTVEGATPARHEQSGLHVNAAYILPATERVYVAVSAGPTYFTARQRVVKSVAVSETYPYDTASFASADLESLSGSGWGFNAGVDVGWMFTRNVGVGGMLRYSRATLSLEPSGRDALDIDAGGLHAGIGARVGF